MHSHTNLFKVGKGLWLRLIKWKMVLADTLTSTSLLSASLHKGHNTTYRDTGDWRSVESPNLDVISRDTGLAKRQITLLSSWISFLGFWIS